MDYIAFGHIHAGSGLKKAGSCYYSWPGCPEGRGFDETGEKYVSIVSFGDGKCSVEPVNIARRRYEILSIDLTGRDPIEAVSEVMPDGTENDIYRLILRGETEEAPDKMRYAPWSGAAMQGTMELSAGGRDICLIRKTKQSSAPMREFSAVYSGTNIPVEGMTGLNAGQMLTGVGREVFRRSAFVEQGAVAVSGSPELEKRISAIVSTGEEDCSFTEADDRLRAWQRKRRYNKRGRLPELEARMSETKRRLSGLEEAARERDSLSAELERAKAAAYEAGKQRRRILSKYKAENEDDIKTCEAEYLELYERFRQAEAEEKAAAGRLEEMRRHQEQTEDMAAQEAGMSVFLITDCMINRENKDISVYPHGSFEQLAEYVKKNK